MLQNVASQIQGLAERIVRGNVLVAMLKITIGNRSRADKLRTCQIIGACINRKQIERQHGLVVIHGQHRIIFAPGITQEERIGGKRSKSIQAFVSRLVNGHFDDLFIFLAKQAEFASMRIKAQHGNFWRINAEILFKASDKTFSLPKTKSLLIIAGTLLNGI